MSIRPEVPARNLTELRRADLHALMADWGEPRFRADQIYAWIYKHGVSEFEQMTNLSKALRQRFVDEGWSIGRLRVGRVAESVDGTRKIAFRTDDEAAIESVLIPMDEGEFTQCISSQVGCALGCTFCYTATLGLARHMTPGEIVDQVVQARKSLPEGWRISRLVYMGMGEPLHNLDGVLRSLEVICDPDALGFTHKRVTISTSGMVPQIRKLGEAAPVNLAISLNASDDATRDVVMPINKKYPIAELMAAVRDYPLAKRRKITFEYVLLKDTNDTDEDAHRLVGLLRDLPVRLNLLQWNPFKGPNYERPSDERVRAFQRILLDAGLRVTVRMSRGLDIDAACGQLGERPAA